MLKRLWTVVFFFLLMIGVSGASSPANSAGTLVVVDVHGKVVGTLFTLSTVIREIDGAMLAIPVFADGFVDHQFVVLYASADCTRTNYLGAEDIPLNAGVQTEGSAAFSGKARVYYPASPLRTIHVRSVQNGLAGSCTTLPSPSPTRAGVLTSRLLIFSPPFKAQ
jgi:hypothetical protein